MRGESGVYGMQWAPTENSMKRSGFEDKCSRRARREAVDEKYVWVKSSFVAWMWLEQWYHRSVKSERYSRQEQFQNNSPRATQGVRYYSASKILQTRQFGRQLDFHSLPWREASFGICDRGPGDGRIHGPPGDGDVVKDPRLDSQGRVSGLFRNSFQMLICTWRCRGLRLGTGCTFILRQNNLRHKTGLLLLLLL